MLEGDTVHYILMGVTKDSLYSARELKKGRRVGIWFHDLSDKIIRWKGGGRPMNMANGWCRTLLLKKV